MSSPEMKGKKTSTLSLEDQFAFYGSYHTNKVNVLIHVVCVPLIFGTALILLHYFPHPVLFSVSVGNSVIDVTPSVVIASTYAAYFILLEPVAGLLYAPLLVALGHYSNVFWNARTQSDALRTAGAVHAASWILQFVGHGAFEGRAPALLTSLFQSVVLAVRLFLETVSRGQTVTQVFFVWLEVLFMMGYRPALHKRIQNRIGVAVTEYRRTLKR